MKFFLKGTLLGFISLLVCACSADYDYTINIDANSLTFISLKSNFEYDVAGVDQTLIFSVIDDITGEDITAVANFYVNGASFSGNAYAFQETGTYIFTAKVNDKETNPLTFQVVSGRFVTVNQSRLLRGQQVEFKFFNTSGQDITQTATFFVNGSVINGNAFSSSTAGIYEVFAQYGGTAVSPATSFEVFIPKRKVSYEDYTGTWCGWCPRVTNAIHILNELSSDIVAIAIHNNDVMVHSQAQELLLRQTFNVTGFPAARMNRIQVVPQLNEDQPQGIDFVLNVAGSNTDNSIAIDTKLSGDLLKVKVKLLSENGLPADYKLVVYLYQNGLIYPQVNYYHVIESSPWFGLGNPIPDFVHNEVLEVSISDLFGDPIQQVQPFEEFVVEYDPINLNEFAHTEGVNTFDPQRFGIAVFLVNQSNETLNAQHVKAGQSVSFE